MKLFQNPVISGFHPDPSVCRHGEDYFLVTSSMEYFPGIPVFHSRDLVHWKQIGHVLETVSGLNLDNAAASGGIMAPTIRYYNGIFYVACKGNGKDGHFVCKSENPFDGWSEPYQIGGEGGDSSLFFDDDGRAWFTANRQLPDRRFDSECQIWMQEFDYHAMKLVGDIYPLWSGTGGIFCEAPHIYKRNGWYYLVVAEGSTFHAHAVTIARCREVNGEYEPNPCNPVLTHRHLSRNYPIMNVGHADIIETQNGQWWGFALGSRHSGDIYEPPNPKFGGYHRVLGRETFLFPVQWEMDWPVFCPDTGKIEEQYPMPDLPEDSPLQPCACDQFEDSSLDCRWVFLRTPRGNFWSLTERPGFLRLMLKPDGLEGNPAMVCRRQEHLNFSASTKMEFLPMTHEECAGMTVFLEQRSCFKLVCVSRNGKRFVILTSQDGSDERELASVAISDGAVFLRIEGHELEYSFYVKQSGEWQPLLLNADGRMLALDYYAPQCRHTGSMIGLYTSANGTSSVNHADFDWFEYTEIR